MSFAQLPRDVKLKVLEDLNDRDLLNFCRTDTAGRELCKNEDFWRKRTLSRFENIKIPYGMTWRQYYLFRLSHEVIVVEPIRGVKAEIIIDKNSQFMRNLLERLKEVANEMATELIEQGVDLKLKDDDTILSLLAQEIALKFDLERDNLDDLDLGDLLGISTGGAFDLTQEQVDEYYRRMAEDMQRRGIAPLHGYFPQLPQLPQLVYQPGDGLPIRNYPLRPLGSPSSPRARDRSPRSPISRDRSPRYNPPGSPRF